jgi:hypothetical protein
MQIWLGPRRRVDSCRAVLGHFSADAPLSRAFSAFAIQTKAGILRVDDHATRAEVTGTGAASTFAGTASLTSRRSLALPRRTRYMDAVSARPHRASHESKAMLSQRKWWGERLCLKPSQSF